MSKSYLLGQRDYIKANAETRESLAIVARDMVKVDKNPDYWKGVLSVNT